MMAAPMTYSIEGEQYIAIMAGLGGVLGSIHPPGSAAFKYGNQGRIIAFKLGGGEVPHPAERDQQGNVFPMPPPMPHSTTEQLELGGKLFQRNCAVCHTNTGGGSIPDLRKMNTQTHSEFMDIVLKGIRADKGMGNFSAILSPEEAEAIHVHLINLAWKNFANINQAPGSHGLDVNAK